MRVITLRPQLEKLHCQSQQEVVLKVESKYNLRGIY